MKADLQVVDNLFDYFRERVDAARSDAGLDLSPDSTLYLAQLLAEQAHVAGEPAEPVTLAELHARAAAAPPGEQARTYRALGDRALYDLGYFEEQVDRRLVTRDYVASMGTAAYARVDQVLERWFAAAFGDLFRELAARFGDCVRVVSGVRRVHDAEEDVDHLHETWLRTGDEAIARKLRRRGLLIPRAPLDA
ncbi:MAG: hypothetical protein H6732_19175 [Alphaproteobacteria bacterium]|nr:hypothetical protein [Alphaproteobacteria bacterium]